jgi:hypothetical protein
MEVHTESAPLVRGLQSNLRGRTAHGQKGAALVFSLIAVLLISSLGAGLIQLQSMTERRQSFAIDRRKALYLAEAGLGEAALAVSLGKSGIIASEGVPATFGEGVYWVESDDLPDDRMLLTCTAQVASAEIVARTLVAPNVNPVARLGFFGSMGVELGAGTVLDGYHSGRGSYSSQLDKSLSVATTGELGLVGSDHDVTLLAAAGKLPAESESGCSEEEWKVITGEAGERGELPVAEGSEEAEAKTSTPTYVFGEVRPGLSGMLESDGSCVVTGGVRPYGAPPLLPEISLPTPAEQIDDDVLVTGLRLGVCSTSQTDVRGTITVATGATLRVDGPAVVVANLLVVESGGALILDDTLGPIQIFLREGMELRSGSSLNSAALDTDARGTRIFVAGTAEPRDRVTLAAAGYFHGLLYAPDDEVCVPASLRWVGGIAARILKTEEEARLTVDRRLAIGGDGLPTLPELLAWQLIPTGDTIARELAFDPLLSLRLRGVTPLLPGQASPEDEVTLQYVDSDGQAAIYSGSITAFDPVGATEIVGASWEDPRDGLPRAWATPPGTDSTGATSRVRADLTAIRAIVLKESPGIDVSSLSDEETMVELAALPETADLSGAPQSAERVLARDDVAVDADQAERDRAARAARSALSMAEEARALADDAAKRAEAAGAADAADAADAEDFAKKVDKEAAKTEVHAEDAKLSAIAASTATGAAISAEADDTEKHEASAKADLEKAHKQAEKLTAAGY